MNSDWSKALFKANQEGKYYQMKKHIALFLVVAMLLALCACTSQPAKDTTSEQTTADASSNSDAAANTDDSTETAAPTGETVTIRVSGLNQQLSLPLWYIHEQGWDVENGFNLELTVFAQGSGINEALGSGLVDVFTIGAAGISSCSVYDAVYLYSHEDSGAGQNFVVRADSDIAQVKGELADYPEVYGSADTLRGKKFLLPMGTAAQILADVYLQQFGLTEDDVDDISGFSREIAGVEIDAFASEMFEAGEKLDGKTAEEVFLQDFKVFMCGDVRFGVAQGSYMTRKNLKAAQQLLTPYLPEACGKQNVEDLYMLLTDVPKEESVVICTGRHADEMLRSGFEKEPEEDGSWTLPGVVSRKKQFIPALMSAYQEL